MAAYVRRVQAGEAGSGDLVEGDKVPETLNPIFKTQMKEQMPVLQKTAEMLGAWAKDVTSGTDVPRGFGMVEFEIGGFEGECAARGFPLWRLQAATDEIDAMSAADKARAEAWLDTVGGAPLMDFRLPVRLAREEYRLKLA